ncbi:MAG TPA: GNAT family N-acetyltransferase [Opitutus sp.]|nr:GNAT family N-acetyltransferase [Opitutus sp.]
MPCIVRATARRDRGTRPGPLGRRDRRCLRRIHRLAEPRFAAHFTPCVEIGWRFRREFWGRGLAFAAAEIAERHAFEILGLPELVSFTAAINSRSRRLRERPGFRHDECDDFVHPQLPAASPLRLHVLHRKRRASAPPPSPGQVSRIT